MPLDLGHENLEVWEVVVEAAGIAGDQSAAIGVKIADENVANQALGESSGASGGNVRVPSVMYGLGVGQGPGMMKIDSRLIEKPILLVQIPAKRRGQFHAGVDIDIQSDGGMRKKRVLRTPLSPGIG